MKRVAGHELVVKYTPSYCAGFVWESSFPEFVPLGCRAIAQVQGGLGEIIQVPEKRYLLGLVVPVGSEEPVEWTKAELLGRHLQGPEGVVYSLRSKVQTRNVVVFLPT